jgi:hypothetical protein
MKEQSLIRISKPTPQVPIQPSEDELEQEAHQAHQNLLGQLQQPETEPIEFAPPTYMRFAGMSYSGWKASDILREIRLDSFEMSDSDME